jgi:hypothetical protein
MTKILNLDKIVTKREKVIVLGGVEHVMTTLTVKEYIAQMKSSQELNDLIQAEDLNSADKILNLTIETLMKVFPTITREQFEGLNMDQLSAIRELAEDAADEDAPQAETEGEAPGNPAE